MRAARVAPPRARRSHWILAGLVAGQALVVLVDRMVGGPGPFALFGL